MINLLKAQYYKLLHKQSFWGLLLFSLVLGSLLLLDSRNTTADLLKGSLYNLPQMYFIPLIFTALFVGKILKAGRSTAWSAPAIREGRFFHHRFILSDGMYRSVCASSVVSLYSCGCAWAKSFPPLRRTSAYPCRDSCHGNAAAFIVFLFRDTGKAFAIPMVLFFLMIFVLNSSYAPAASIVLPMGQLRLLALDEVTFPVWLPLGIDCFWIVLSCLIACGSFCRSELK